MQGLISEPLTGRRGRVQRLCAPRRAFAGARDEGGAILVETAFSVSAVLLLALAFTGVLAFATEAIRAESAVHDAVRESVLRRTLIDAPGVTFACRLAPDGPDMTCDERTRGDYLVATKTVRVRFPFGLELATAERAVARVE